MIELKKLLAAAAVVAVMGVAACGQPATKEGEAAVDAAANTVPENAATGTVVGITAQALDPDGTATVTYSLTDNAGGRFTMADTYVGSQFVWGLRFGSIPERPSFRAYVDRITQRPAYAAANGVDAAIIKGAQG
jgi:hypothetical protein